MGKIAIKPRYGYISADKWHVKQCIKKVAQSRLSFDVIDCVDRPAIARTPVNASHIPLSAENNRWPADKGFVMVPDNPAGTIHDNLPKYSAVSFQCLAIFQRCKFSECCSLPPLWNTVVNFDMFVTGKTEADEPLLVEQPCGLFKQLNPPAVVFDQVVVGGEDGGGKCQQICRGF